MHNSERNSQCIRFPTGPAVLVSRGSWRQWRPPLQGPQHCESRSAVRRGKFRRRRHRRQGLRLLVQ